MDDRPAAPTEPPLRSTATSAMERRPLASRETRWAKAAAAALARGGVSPNAISVAGAVFGVAAGGAFVATSRWTEAAPWLLVAAAALVQLRLLCNLLDGMVAVEGGRRSPVGELYNEAPDRISDAATLAGAGLAAGCTPWLGAAAACVALWVAYVRTLAKAAGAPNDFCGPMAKPHRMFVVTVFAFVQAVTPGASMRVISPLDFALVLVVVGGLWTSIRRLVRAARHLRGVRP